MSITAGAKNGADDPRLNLGLTYRIGEPLAHQLDSSQVGAQRSLVANRLELVNRNNDVVLEYRKQTLITLQLPPDVRCRADDRHSDATGKRKIRAVPYRA
ncbi:inverse autotransporter beta domain-containing protein [Salmonella enterica]